MFHFSPESGRYVTPWTGMVCHIRYGTKKSTKDSFEQFVRVARQQDGAINIFGTDVHFYESTFNVFEKIISCFDKFSHFSKLETHIKNKKKNET